MFSASKFVVSIKPVFILANTPSAPAIILSIVSPVRLFVTLVPSGVFSIEILLEIALTTYLLKWVVAAADTPFIYLARRWKQRKLVE